MRLPVISIVHTQTHTLARALKLLHIFEHNTIKHANIIIHLNNGGIPGPLNHRSTSYLFSCVNFFLGKVLLLHRSTLERQNFGRHSCVVLCCAGLSVTSYITNKNSEIFSHANVILWCNKFRKMLLIFNLHYLTHGIILQIFCCSAPQQKRNS